MSDLSEQAHEFLEEQKRSWEFLRRQCELLAGAESRTFDFDRFSMRVQHNPTRIASVSAKVDPEAIRNRKCFLCDANRPAEQKSLAWKHGFKILCNPFPILPQHFTVVQTEHRPQRILPSIPIMIELARELTTGYTVFYNGPQCGASAPDHMHFQAGTKGFMPIDNDYDRVKKLLIERDGVRTFVDDNYQRRFISFESTDPESLAAAFTHFHKRLSQLQPHADEPMMNVLCRFDEPQKTWRLLAFVRVKHRPSFYFAEDHTRMLLSPGAVDMSGIVVMPREEDFRRITRKQLIEMYCQVTLPDEQFDLLIGQR